MTQWTAAHQASLLFTVSWNLLKLMSIESVMLPNHFILCCPHLLLQSFPASGTFPKSWLFTSGGPSIGASVSASILKAWCQAYFLSLLYWFFLISLTYHWSIPGLHPCSSSFLATADSLDALNSFMTLITISVLTISTFISPAQIFLS